MQLLVCGQVGELGVGLRTVTYHHLSGTFTLDDSKCWLGVDKSVLPATKPVGFTVTLTGTIHLLPDSAATIVSPLMCLSVTDTSFGCGFRFLYLQVSQD